MTKREKEMRRIKKRDKAQLNEVVAEEDAVEEVVDEAVSVLPKHSKMKMKALRLFEVAENQRTDKTMTTVTLMKLPLKEVEEVAEAEAVAVDSSLTLEKIESKIEK